MGKKYTYDDLKSEGWSDERIRGWKGWDKSEPGTGYVQKRAPEGSGAVDAWHAPAWWNSEENGDWTGAQAESYHAWQSVLGRDPGTSQGINLLSGMGYEDAVQALSLTPEARMRGVDPTKFGNEILSADDVPEDLKPYYDEWARINGDEPFYSGHEQLLRWQKDMGSVEVQQAINDGTIQQLGPQAYQVTQAAVDKYGADKLRFTGYNRNAIIMVPKGSGVQVGRKKHGTSTARLYEADAEEGEDPWTKQYVDEGYDVYLATGSVHQGFMDRIQHDVAHATGMSEDAAATLMFAGSGGTTGGDFINDVLGIKEGYFMTDPGGFVSGWFYGDKGNQKNIEGAMSFTGGDKNDPDDWKKTQRLQGYGSSAFQAAIAFVPVVGWAISAGLGAARSMGQAQTGQAGWDQAVLSSAISAAAAWAGAGSDGSGASFAGAGLGTAGRIGASAAAGAAQAAIYGNDVGTGALVGGLSGAAGAFANSAGAAANLGNMSQAFVNAATAAAASYGGAYLTAWGNGDEVADNAGFNALLAGASSLYDSYKTPANNAERYALAGGADAGFLGRFGSDFGQRMDFAGMWDAATPWPTHRESLAAGRQAVFQPGPITGPQQPGAGSEMADASGQYPSVRAGAATLARLNAPPKQPVMNEGVAVSNWSPTRWPVVGVPLQYAGQAFAAGGRDIGNFGARTVNWATDEARPWIRAQEPAAPAADPWAPFVDFYRDQGFATVHGY